MKICYAGAAAILLAACANPDSGSQGAARVIASIPIANAGFEEPGGSDRVAGWTLSQHAGTRAYEMTQDAVAPFAGYASFRMRRIHDQVYGLLYQEVAVDGFAGKTLELSAMARTADVGSQGWVLFLDVPGGRETSAPLTGTTAWRELRVRAKLPPGAAKVSVGVLLLDGGTGWLDEVQLHVVEP